MFVYYENNKEKQKTKKFHDAMSKTLYNYRYYYINTDKRCRDLLKNNGEIIVQYENGGNFKSHK